MSQFEVEQPDPASSGSDASQGEQPTQAIQLARYTIHVPTRDNDGREIPHILSQIRQELTTAGYPGRTVVRNAQGDWLGDEEFYETEGMDLVMIDAPATPQALADIQRIAGRLKELAGQEAIYLTVQQLQAYLI